MASTRMRPLLQPGNSVRAVWRARLDEHLGMYAIEGLNLRAASLFASSHAIYGVTHLAALVRLLPERDPQHLDQVLALCVAVDFLIDGTERPTQRPTDPIEQKEQYSGKKKGIR